MKLISYILFTLFIMSGLARSNSFASTNFTETVKTLVEKEYIFYAHKKSTIYYLNGRKRFQKVTFEEFLDPKMFSTEEKAFHIPGIAKDMVFFNKKGFKIILRKKSKYYIFKNGKLSKFSPLATMKRFIKKNP